MTDARLDKFLQVSRLVKRRTLAQEVVRAGHVEVAGRVAKPGTELKVGDRLDLVLGRRRIAVRVLDLPERPRPGQEGLFEVIEETVAPAVPWGAPREG